MDIISHGLWGSLAFGRKNRRFFWWSFFFGVFPDLSSFGFYTVGTWIGLFPHPDWSSGQHPSPEAIPTFVHVLYSYSHSLIIFLAVFGLAWFFVRRPIWPLAAWGLHILVDIPTHASEFFPTPFLFPISDFHIDGVSWGHPMIFFPNAVLLIGLYALWYLKRKYPGGAFFGFIQRLFLSK